MESYTTALVETDGERMLRATVRGALGDGHTIWRELFALANGAQLFAQGRGAAFLSANEVYVNPLCVYAPMLVDSAKFFTDVGVERSETLLESLAALFSVRLARLDDLDAGAEIPVVEVVALDGEQVDALVGVLGALIQLKRYWDAVETFRKLEALIGDMEDEAGNAESDLLEIDLWRLRNLDDIYADTTGAAVDLQNRGARNQAKLQAAIAVAEAERAKLIAAIGTLDDRMGVVQGQLDALRDPETGVAALAVAVGELGSEYKERVGARDELATTIATNRVEYPAALDKIRARRDDYEAKFYASKERVAVVDAALDDRDLTYNTKSVERARLQDATDREREGRDDAMAYHSSSKIEYERARKENDRLKAILAQTAGEQSNLSVRLAGQASDIQQAARDTAETGMGMVDARQSIGETGSVGRALQSKIATMQQVVAENEAKMQPLAEYENGADLDAEYTRYAGALQDSNERLMNKYLLATERLYTALDETIA